MKGLSLLSGGKDSFLSTVIAMEQGIDVDLSLTVIPEEFSMMYHYPNTSWAKLVAVMLNTKWRSIQETDLENSLLSLKEDGYTVLVIGATASDYQKTRMEYLCNKTGINLSPQQIHNCFITMCHKITNDSRNRKTSARFQSG